MSEASQKESRKKEIPFFNYAGMAGEDLTEVMGVLEGVVRRGAFILQKEVADFEAAVSEYLGVRHTIGLANCTDALFLGLKACGLRPGDEVIIPSHTFVATAGAVHMAGGVPVPVECGRDHMMDTASADAAVTKKTRAVMPVQLNGRVCDMKAVKAFAARHDLDIYEDSAQALGASFEGQKAGTFGRFGAFSFYPAKTLGCFGDGGALVTNDDEVARLVRLYRDHGRNAIGQYEVWGGNSRLDNLQAAVLNLRLTHYERDIETRRQLAARYHERLSGISGLVLPPPPVEEGPHFDIFQNYEIEAGERDALRDFLQKNGVRTILQWGGVAVHQMKKLGFTQSLPVTDEVMKRSFLLPMNTMVSRGDVDRICDIIGEFYASRNPV